MNKLVTQWQQWNEKFISLSIREKGLISGALIFVLCIGLYKLAVEPSSMQLNTIKNNTNLVLTSYTATTGQINSVQGALNTDPNEKIKNEITVLKKQLAQVESELDKVMTDYVAPGKMTAELTRLLETSKEVRIIAMSVLPTQEIETDTELDLPVYYRHQFEVSVTGDYFSLMEFVNNITTKNKQFGIQHLSYEVTEHPKATMTLSLVTISDNANVIKI
ncbi:hypothetical protein KO505_16010 [Psychrosphaera sp. F3M07]|jgi:MSHA biogenesis protein MshJ|uniref:hypothetical protein n=1 Tax=Psychrosphaera sp. F3M07 TaxID=2841560 RepID=UPI001C095D5F|nr:hypothetical protein [Psychrosphaera sp. F3M07]MBU2919455.1 hypothetical protein [Psychrosphaera sp. F3M07]